MESPIPHLAIIPSPGMGHLIPLIEFAKQLVLNHRITLTFLIPTNSPPSTPHKSVLSSLPAGIHHHFLPPVNFDDLPVGTKIETIISLTISRSVPSLRNALNSITNLVGLIVDLFGTDAFDLATEFNISPYVFFPSTAMLLSFALFLPKLHESFSGEYRDFPEKIKIPGCIPIDGKDLLDPVQDRKNDAYKWTLHNMKRYVLAEGIFVNSFLELEPGAINFLQKQEQGIKTKPPVYPIGPLVRIDTNEEEKTECLKWLDEQPDGSVLLVSFGSGGALSIEQINELAMGLELSGHKFIWVVKNPSNKAADASYFTVQGKNGDPLGFLPEGFVQRTKNRGFVVASWAPQARILSHKSTGGFLTHCGWNSSLESVVNGVPLIAWPLYAEQRMNAAMLTEEIGVALRAKGNDERNGIVEKEEISKLVKSLMEGEEGKKLRAKMKDLKVAGERVVGEDGSSTQIIKHLLHKWNTNITL